MGGNVPTKSRNRQERNHRRTPEPADATTGMSPAPLGACLLPRNPTPVICVVDCGGVAAHTMDSETNQRNSDQGQ